MKWRILPAFLLVVLIASVVSAGQGRTKRWWLSEEYRAELGLTEGQANRIEEIYESARPRLRSADKKLDREEAVLSGMIEGMEAAEAEVIHQIDRVEAARSELSKARMLMVYRMHRVLSPDQNTALHRLLDRDRGRRGSSGSR